jgi:hypothetical protein
LTEYIFHLTWSSIAYYHDMFWFSTIYVLVLTKNHIFIHIYIFTCSLLLNNLKVTILITTYCSIYVRLVYTVQYSTCFLPWPVAQHHRHPFRNLPFHHPCKEPPFTLLATRVALSLVAFALAIIVLPEYNTMKLCWIATDKKWVRERHHDWHSDTFLPCPCNHTYQNDLPCPCDHHQHRRLTRMTYLALVFIIIIVVAGTPLPWQGQTCRVQWKREWVRNTLSENKGQQSTTEDKTKWTVNTSKG